MQPQGQNLFYFQISTEAPPGAHCLSPHCTNPVSDEPSVSRPHISTSLSRLWVKIPSSRMSKREFSFADVRPSCVTKKTVSYCETSTSDLELEFDEDGYERFKTKSFKNKANATKLPTATATSSSSALTQMSRTSPSRTLCCFHRWSRRMRR